MPNKIETHRKQTKSQKKFSKKHLSRTIRKRHETKHIRRASAKRDLKRKRQTEDGKRDEEDAHEKSVKKLRTDKYDDRFDDDDEAVHSDPFEELPEGDNDENDTDNEWPSDGSESGERGERGEREENTETKPRLPPPNKTVAKEEQAVEHAMREEGEGAKVITKELFDDWMENKMLRMVVVAYCSAVRTIVTGGKAEPTLTFNGDQKLARQVVMTVLKYCTQLFDDRIGRTSKKKREPATYEVQWAKYSLFVRRFIRHTIRLLNFYTDHNDISYILKHCVELVPYMTTFTPIARIFLKTLLKLLPHEKDFVRLTSFVNIQALAKEMKYPFVELCMKGVFLVFFRTCKTFSQKTSPTILRLMEFTMQLYGMDLVVAYQQSFIFIRQMALWLRNAMQHPCEENYTPIYSWQYVSSLRLLGLLIMKYNGTDQLGALTHPWVQLCCGVIELFPAPKCFTLHLCVIGLLNRMSSTADVYIPVSAYILRILQSAEYSKPYPPLADEAPDLTFMLKVKKSQIKSFGYLTAVFREAVYLLIEHLAQWSNSIAFPELAHLSVSVLRKMRKSQIKVSMWNNVIRDTIIEINNNVEWITKRRDKVDFSPIDMMKIKVWENEAKQSSPPLVKYYATTKARRQAATKKSESATNNSQTPNNKQKGNNDKDTTTDKKENNIPIQPQRSTPITENKRLVLEDALDKAAKRERKKIHKAEKEKQARFQENYQAPGRRQDQFDVPETPSKPNASKLPANLFDTANLVDDDDDADAYGVDDDLPSDMELEDDIKEEHKKEANFKKLGSSGNNTKSPAKQKAVRKIKRKRK